MKQKQITPRQFLNHVCIENETAAAESGLRPEDKLIANVSAYHAILKLIDALKQVHLGGGNAGEFLNGVETECIQDMASVIADFTAKKQAAAKAITDNIVKPGEN